MPEKPDKTEKTNSDDRVLTEKLDDNVALFKDIFAGDETLRIRQVSNYNDMAFRACVMFLDGMINARIINENILTPLMEAEFQDSAVLMERVETCIISCNEVSRSGELKKLTEAMLAGDTLLFADGCSEALMINSKGFATRGISEPDGEKTLLGPREGFTEALMTNISMLRRKLKTTNLKIGFRSFGAHTNTRACVCYLENLADLGALSELQKRLDAIEMNSALDINYIQERITDAPYSIFKTTGESEKPDIVASKLLEGRIAVMLDGTPMVMTVPYLFAESLHSPDDYYLNFYYGSFGRLLRVIGLLLTVSVPALYIALLSFHREMIPSSLMFSLTAAAKGTPFPVTVEVLGMLALFEVLREAGMRMSDKLGSALGIVGGLVLGQAAVEAKFASASTVIIVAITSITGMLLPRLKLSVLTLRILFLVAAGIIGIHGYLMAALAFLVYLLNVKSFGVDYTSRMFSFGSKDKADVYLRFPFGRKKRR